MSSRTALPHSGRAFTRWLPLVFVGLLVATFCMAQGTLPAPVEDVPTTWDNIKQSFDTGFVIAKSLLKLSQLLICTWSALAIFVWMVASKYRRTSPNYPVLGCYFGAGILSTICALSFNMELSTKTRFTFFFAENWVDSAVAFFVGAGLGEEFWKLAAGLMVAVAAMGLSRRQSPADRALGFVVCGLGFAVVENLITYAPNLDAMGMIRRGFLAVPVHASMGLIHGVIANRTLKSGHFWWLPLGYLLASFLHGLYDTIWIFTDVGLEQLGAKEVWPDFMEAVPAELLVGPMVFLLAMWFYRTWRATPEWEEALPEDEWAATAAE